MARRGHAARRVIQGKSRIWTPANEPSLFSWMRGDDPGAAINTTPDPHQYAAIPDRGSLGGAYEQSTSGSQPIVSEDWEPGPVPFFADGRRFQHSADVGNWSLLYDGTSDVDVHVLFLIPSLSGTQTLIRNLTTFNATGVLLHVTSGGNLVFNVGNASGTAALELGTGNGAISAGTLHWGAIRKRSANVELLLDGSVADSGVITAPNNAAPNTALFLGATNIGNNPLIGFVPELTIFSGAPLPSFSLVETYLSRWSYTP